MKVRYFFAKEVSEVDQEKTIEKLSINYLKAIQTITLQLSQS